MLYVLLVYVFRISFLRKKALAPHCGAPQGQMVLAVSHLLSSLWGSDGKSETELIPKSLNLSDSQTEILKTGIYSYLLPGQEALRGGDISALSFAPAFEKYVSQEILKVHTEPHHSDSSFFYVIMAALSCFTFHLVVFHRPVERSTLPWRVSWFTVFCGRESLNAATLWRMQMTRSCCLRP